LTDNQLYVVTGGAGFIGSHICDALVKRGSRVRVIDNFSSGRRRNLEHLGNAVEILEADLADREPITKALEGASVVFHEAAIPSVPRSIVEPRASHRANVEGTFNLLMAAHENRVRRVVYAASSSAYGETETLPKIENMLPQPLSPYAAGKLFGEYYSQVFTRVYGLETVALRYFNVFGPRQDPSSPYSGVISRFVTALLNGESPVIYGDGEQSRDFTFVTNVVRANLDSAESAEANGQVINVGNGQRITLNRLLAELQRILGTKIEPRYESSRAGDVRHSLADISRAQALLGYQPQVGLEEGLKLTVEWYQERREGRGSG
jgi:UDP-glucose 4-epimerase